MKKILFIALIVALTTCVVSAQSKRIFFGLGSSFDWNSFVFANEDNLKGKPGLSAGPFVRVEISERVSTDFGVCYSLKSYAYTIHYVYYGDVGDPLVNQTDPVLSYNFSYLDLPIDLNYKLKNGKVSNFYVSAGVINSLLLANTRKVDGSKISSSPDYDKYLLSIKTAFGYQFRTKAVSISIEPQVRYYITNSNVFYVNKPVHIGLEISVLKL